MVMIIIIIIIRVIIILIRVDIVYFFQSFVLLPSFILLSSLVSLQMEEQRNSFQPSSLMLGTRSSMFVSCSSQPVQLSPVFTITDGLSKAMSLKILWFYLAPHCTQQHRQVSIGIHDL